MLKKICCLVVCVLFFQFGAGVCTASESNIHSIDDEVYLCSVLEGLESGNEAAIGKYFDKKFLNNSEEPFKDMIRLWNGKKVTNYKKITESVVQADGLAPEKILYKYQVQADKENYIVTFELYEDKAEIKMASFDFTYTPKVTGSISTWREFNALQWGMMFICILEISFSIYILMLCISKEKKHRILWCFAIILLYGGIYVAYINTELHLGAYVYLLRLPQLLLYQDYGWELKASIPVGAIVYYMKWKKDRKGNLQ
ncbi:MAG: hypothetical protein Q4F28_03175 [Eubacteriales bacterium]|nr:hypothetical protein [Eubacteriales bacterium]